MKKVLSNIIFIIVICVFGYLLISNVLHVIYLNKYDTFDFNSKSISDIRTNIKELELNIEKISKLDNSVYTQEELNLIKNTFNIALANIKSSKLLSYGGSKRIYLKDLLNIDLSRKSSISENINMLEKLSKYDNTINSYIEVYKYDFLNNAFNSEMSFQEVIKSYKYNSIDMFNNNIIEVVNARLLARVYGLSDEVVSENYFAKLVLEIGGADNE